MNCSVCGGQLIQLGTLGNLVWCRCQNCGMDQSVEWNPDEDREEVEDVC